MKKTKTVPFASKTESLGYRELVDRRNAAAVALSQAAAEIGLRGAVPEGANALLVMPTGIEFSWDEPEPAAPPADVPERGVVPPRGADV